MTWTSERPSKNAGLVWMQYDPGCWVELRFIRCGLAYRASGTRAGDIERDYTTAMWHPWSLDEPKPEPPVRHVPDMVWCDAPDRPGWWQGRFEDGATSAAERWVVDDDGLLVDESTSMPRSRWGSRWRFRRIPDTIAATLEAP